MSDTDPITIRVSERSVLEAGSCNFCTNRSVNVYEVTCERYGGAPSVRFCWRCAQQLKRMLEGSGL